MKITVGQKSQKACWLAYCEPRIGCSTTSWHFWHTAFSKLCFSGHPESLSGILNSTVVWVSERRVPLLNCDLSCGTSVGNGLCVVPSACNCYRAVAGPMAGDGGPYSSGGGSLEQRAPPAAREERRQPVARPPPPPAEEDDDANDVDSDEASELAVLSAPSLPGGSLKGFQAASHGLLVGWFSSVTCMKDRHASL